MLIALGCEVPRQGQEDAAATHTVFPQWCQLGTLPPSLFPLDEHAFCLDERC